MSDQKRGDDPAPFIKMPPGAFRDARFGVNHFRVLGLVSEVRDWKSDVSDLSQVQLAQALNVRRQYVQRVYADLVKWGYFSVVGRVSEHGQHKVRVIFAPADQMDLVEHIAAHTPAPQEVQPPCNSQGAPLAPSEVQPPATPEWSHPATGEVHSSGSPENKQTNRRAQAREADGSCEPGSYWDLPLEASDLKPSTPLVQEGRNLGFARENGRDGLQEQHGHFLRHRAKRNYRKPPKRSEFREWLRKATANRSDLTGTAEKSTTITAPAKPSSDDLEIPAFLKREAAPPPPKWQLRLTPGASGWRRGLLKSLEAVAAAHGDTAADYVAQCVVENQEGAAVLRAKMPDHARMIRERYFPTFSAAWVESLGEIPVHVLSAKENLDAHQNHDA